MQCVEALEQYATPHNDSRMFGHASSSAPFYRTGQFSGDNKVVPFGYRNMRNRFQSGQKENVLSAMDRLWHQIEEYSSRELTYNHDGLNAFEGILGDACLVNKLVLFHVSGLPILLASLHFMMVQALLWSTGRFIRSRGHDGYKGASTFSDFTNRRPSLPSWSWVGWTSTIQQPEVKIPEVNWAFTQHYWPSESSAIPSVWLAKLSLENCLGDTLHCGESQAKCWRKLPAFEKTVYLHLESYHYSFISAIGGFNSSLRLLQLKFVNTPTIEHEANSRQWSWEKTANSQWGVTLDPHQPIFQHLARGQSLLIPLMSNERSVFVMLVDVIAEDLVERRGIVRFDRLSDEEKLTHALRIEGNVDELELSFSRMVMVV